MTNGYRGYRVTAFLTQLPYGVPALLPLTYLEGVRQITYLYKGVTKKYR